MKARQAWISWWQDTFALDTRSLAAFRIGLGAILLWDLADRLPDLAAHYADDGLFPRQLLEAPFWNLGWHWSLHALSGDVLWQGFLFALAGLAALALLLGWKTRLATLLCWIFLCSLHARNPAVLHGGDALIRVLLYFAIFLPLNARWALDKAASTVGGQRVFNIASVGVGFQLMLVYLCSVFFKTGPMWRQSFGGVWYAFNYDFIAKPLAARLTQFPVFLKGLTVVTLMLELLGPLLILVSGRRPWLRMTVVAAFWLLHLGIFMTLSIGSFSVVCMLTWLLLVPAQVWDWLRGERIGQAPVLTYGGCLAQVIPGLSIILIALWNASLLNMQDKAEALPGWLKSAVRTPMLNQRWRAFSHEASLRWSGWLLIEGTTADGRRFDLLDGRSKPGVHPPASLHDRWPSERWRKGVRRYLSSDIPDGHQRQLADFFKRRWEAAHPGDKLVDINVYFMVRQVNPPEDAPQRGPLKRFLFLEADYPE